ncbi:hypothetical protein MBLNU230_g4975t1 [Neophaeotheca triangularis]
MGRRKIEIKPIPDERNRSVTFLKRKGGLFKKAHELSVLCSVDVAVIIFGHNKKLYEYSSGDINETVGRFQYYGSAHEHKGPADFADKGGGDGDDDDEDGAAGDEGGDQRATPERPMMQPQMQHHPGFQHVRQHTPGAQNSPPMPNGGMPQFQRGPSPLPPGHPLSRPSSRASQHQTQPQHLRRTSSNLVPQQHAQNQGPPPQPNYAYTPNPPFYNPQQAAAAAQMQQRPSQPGQPMPAATYPPTYAQQHPQHPQQGPTPQQIQQAYMQDSRRQSMPPAFPPQPGPPQAPMSRHPSQDHLQPPQQGHHTPQQHPRPMPSPQPPQQEFPKQEFTSPQMPQPKPLPAHAKNHSIFTPIDDSRSLLAQHWGSTGNAEPPRSETTIKTENEAGPRPASIDVAAMQRQKNANGAMSSPRQRPPQPPSRPLPKSPQPPPRAASVTGAPTPPTRAGTNQSDAAKRPRLRVAIPSEHSGDEGGNTGSAPDETSTSQTAATTGGGGGGSLFQTTNSGPGAPAHGVVLPPPSPSHGALLSAGAQGPPNPFARPPPPMSTNPHAMNRDSPAQQQSQQQSQQQQQQQQHQSQQQPQHAPTQQLQNQSQNIETPISALPSRFMSDNLLPSPSTFYPEWGFGRSGGESGVSLPSPMNFQTPVVGNMAQGWGRSGGTGGGNGNEEERERERERKRGAEEEAGDGGREGKRGRL